MKLTSTEQVTAQLPLSTATASTTGSNLIFRNKSSRMFQYTYKNTASSFLISLFQLTTILILTLTITENSKIYANAIGFSPRCANMPFRGVIPKPTIEPIIEIYQTNGIKVSLPALDVHMNSFEFHANINERIALDERGSIDGKGNFSKYTAQWSFYLDKPVLNLDDRLNYWYEIKINDTIKRFQSWQPFIVEYQLPVRPDFEALNNLIHRVTVPEKVDSGLNEIEASIPICCTKLSNSNEILLLQNEIELLRFELREVSHETIPSLLNELNTLKDVMERNSNETRELLLISQKPLPHNNPVEEVRFILYDRLRLDELESGIAQAKYTKCGIVFEMKSVFYKEHILKEAAEKFKTSNVRIIKAPLNENDCPQIVWKNKFVRSQQEQEQQEREQQHLIVYPE